MNNICAICCDLNDIKENQHLTCCNHLFHKECIKTWYISDHASCTKCPICRTLLNITNIELYDSNLISTYDEFINSDGIYLYGSYVLIKMNSSNWKNLLKNLLVLVSISHDMSFGVINNSKICIKNQKNDMTVGFILEDVNFFIENCKTYENHNEIKMMLFDINELQFEGLKYFDKMLLEITHDNDKKYSFIKKQKTTNGELHDSEITQNTAKILTTIVPYARTYEIDSKKCFDCAEYVKGKCCVAMVPKITLLNGKNYYRLNCIDLALISGTKKEQLSNSEILHYDNC